MDKNTPKIYKCKFKAKETHKKGMPPFLYITDKLKINE